MTQIAAVACLACSTAACSSFGMPRGSTEQGEEIFGLWQIFFWAGIGVAAIVYGLIGWSLDPLPAARRATRSSGGSFHANLPLEIVYTAIPVVDRDRAVRAVDRHRGSRVVRLGRRPT